MRAHRTEKMQYEEIRGAATIAFEPIAKIYANCPPVSQSPAMILGVSLGMLIFSFLIPTTYIAARTARIRNVYSYAIFADSSAIYLSSTNASAKVPSPSKMQ